MGQLKAIEDERQFPPVLRNPAANLRKLLQREMDRTRTQPADFGSVEADE